MIMNVMIGLVRSLHPNSPQAVTAVTLTGRLKLVPLQEVLEMFEGTLVNVLKFVTNTCVVHIL